MPYLLYQTEPGRYVHDIAGIGQTTTGSGFLQTTPGYDEATGIGTRGWRRWSRPRSDSPFKSQGQVRLSLAL
jgi:hypothetical protein